MKISGLNKKFGDLSLYEDFSLGLPEGETSCLLGPSGCGKTSLLNMAAGLMKADGGAIRYERGGEKPRISYVFQEPRLLPWLTAAGNLVYAQPGSLGRHERKEKAREMLSLFGLSEAAGKFPGELSGGMARRVGLARALLSDFDLLLMDEPLASLDQELKESLIRLLKGKLAGHTALLVTHDYYTARMLSDHIFVLSPPPVRAGEIARADLESILAEINKSE